jgi:hypothetical protein
MQRGCASENTGVKTLKTKHKLVCECSCEYQLGVIPLDFCMHVCPLFNEKLADFQVTSMRGQMQRSALSENSSVKTFKTKQNLISE